MRLLSLLAGVAVLAPVASSQAVLTPVISTFDQDLEGWTLASGQNASIDHVAPGGFPGGYVRLTSGGAGRSDIEAPAAYLGDWSHLDGSGLLRFDHKIFSLGALPIGPPYKPFEVVLEGAGASVARFLSSETAQTSWTTALVPLQEPQWSVESGDWASLLSDVVKVQIRIELVGNDGLPDDQDGIDNVMLLDSTATGVPEDVLPLRSKTALGAAYPNPFGPAVTLEFDLGRSGNTRVTIHDAAGRLVRRLFDGHRPSARHSVVWNGRDDAGTRVAGGVYFARLVAGGSSSVKRIVLVR